MHADILPCSNTVWWEPQTRSCLWEAWLHYILSALGQCVHVYQKPGHYKLTTNTTYCRYTPHSYEVGILRAYKSSQLNQLWQLTFAANIINNAVDCRTTKYNPVRDIHFLTHEVRCLCGLKVNYLEVHDIMLVHYTWCYKHIIAWNCIRI